MGKAKGGEAKVGVDTRKRAKGFASEGEKETAHSEIENQAFVNKKATENFLQDLIFRLANILIGTPNHLALSIPTDSVLSCRERDHVDGYAVLQGSQPQPEEVRGH